VVAAVLAVGAADATLLPVAATDTVPDELLTAAVPPHAASRPTAAVPSIPARARASRTRREIWGSDT
jgi:hypothetical protein